MSRYADARAGCPKPAQEQPQARRHNPQETQRIKEYFSARHPLQKLSRERRDAIYSGDLCGGKVDVALNTLEVMLSEGAEFLKNQARGAGFQPAGPAQPDKPGQTAGGQDARPTEQAKRPPYTSATLVRAASEIRKLLDKREALMEEAQRRVMDEWEIAKVQLEISLTRQEPEQAAAAPDDPLAAFEQFFTSPDAQAPPA